MEAITVQRSKLIEIIKQNKSEHRDIFLKAQSKYREEVVRCLDEQLQRAREIDSIVAPQDHTEDYDRALAMLEMSVDSTIKLTMHDFANLVQDEWEWSRQWARAFAGILHGKRDAPMNYSVRIDWSDEDQAYIARAPVYAGCMADGRTRQEALKNVEQIVSEWIAVATEEGRRLPSS